jgi:membrane associated rhomboid family serine protease/tetratricopeptide (TPR) repeat protein
MTDHGLNLEAPAFRAARTGGAALTASFLRRLPWMTLALTAVQLAVMVLHLWAGGWRVERGEFQSQVADWLLGAKVPSLVLHGEYWRLVAAGFLHASYLHVAGNLAGLVVLGTLTERVYGRAGLLAIFVLTSAAGFVTSCLFTPYLALGASAGVMGITGAFLFHCLARWRVLPAQLRRAVPLLFLVVAAELILDAFNTKIDVSAHIGGLLAGGVVGALLGDRRRGAATRIPLRGITIGAAWALLLYGAGGSMMSVRSDLPLLSAERRGDTQALLRLLNENLRGRPHFVEARYYLGISLALRGDWTAAEAQYRAAVLASPAFRRDRHYQRLGEGIAQHYVYAGTRAYEAQRWEEALNTEQRVLELSTDPKKLAHAHNMYAWTLVENLGRDLGTAERHAREAVRLTPNIAAYLDTLAWVLYKQRRYDEAISVQQQALHHSGMGGPLAELYYHLAAIYEAAGRHDEALTYYLRTTQLQPPGSRSPTYLRALEGMRREVRRGTPHPFSEMPDGRDLDVIL